MPAQEYNVGCYLLDRLVEIGCGHLFGVPGDYNLRFLDDVTAQEGLEWVGCANELNAAYAADGYSRCRRIAALLTTYGVGELSALNALAGSCAEHCPVIHVVGGPSTKNSEAGALMHHTLGDGDFHHFVRMSSEISCAFTYLGTAGAQAEIDRVIAAALYHKKPGYIMLPMDVAAIACDPPEGPLERQEAACSVEAAAGFRAAVELKMAAAKSPLMLVGHLCDRFQCAGAAQMMVEDTHIPFASIMLGKGTMNEQSSHHVGCYYGKPSIASVKEVVEEADVCITLGVKFHDFGTAFFSQKIEASRCIDIQPFESTINGTVFGPLPMKKAVEVLHDVARKHRDNWPSTHPHPPAFPLPESDAFSQRHFWTELQAGMQQGDVVVVDQGTASCATAGLVLPEGGRLVVQNLWGSIGFSLPAALGAQLADVSRRVILIVGDGAAQMTVQELGSFIRYKLHPLIFVVNNDGYVIERVIHGWNEEYNDIASWNWCTVMKGLANGKPGKIQVLKEPGTTSKVLQTHTAPVQEFVFSEVMLGRHERPVVTLANW